MTGRSGFTLIELMVVITIVAIVAATAAVRSSHAYRRAQLRRAGEVVREIDRHARQLAQSHQRPCELTIDVSKGLFDLTESDRRGGDANRRWRLPKPLRLAFAGTPRERRRSGDVVVRYDRYGRSDSYGVGIQSPSGAERWMLLAGVTGQVDEGVTRREVEEVLRALSKNRFDAD